MANNDMVPAGSDAISALIHDCIQESGNSMVDAAVAMIEIELGNPEVLDSKVACDALRRAITNVRSLRKAPTSLILRPSYSACVHPILCEECERNYADPPSRLCPGCEAYREHQR